MNAPDARRNALGGTLAVASFLNLTVLVFAPAQIFYGNVMEFPMVFRELLPMLLGVASVGTLLLTGLLFALPTPRVRHIAVTVVFGLALAVWIQSNFLLWPYGVLDGRAIDWDAHWRHGLVDAAVWCLVVTGAAVGFRTVRRFAVRASVAFVLLQAGAVAIQARNVPDRWIDHMAFDDSDRFSFSRDKNIIVMVLDTFQSDLFQEMLDEDPSLAETFRGFTYFRNATAGFSGTTPSIPLILTGQYYDNAVPFQAFVKSAFRTNSLPKVLKDAGFHVSYNHPWFWPSLYADESTASNTREKTSWNGRVSWPPASHLIKLGLFRSLPQAGKRLLPIPQAVYVPQDDGAAAHLSAAARNTEAGRRTLAAIPWMVGDALFFREMALLASAGMPSPTFKYYHLQGIHPPLEHDENLQAQSLAFTRENAKRQAKGLVRLLETLIATLVDRGLYDKTVLIFVGDHGARFDPRLVEVESRRRSRPGTVPVATSNSFGLPLVLVKPIGAAEPLTISDAPVSLADIPRTVTSVLGLPSSLPGKSMLDPVDDAPRARRVLKYESGAQRVAHAYFPVLTEYEVSGFSWLDESWRPTGRQFLPGKAQLQSTAAPYRLGHALRFGIGGNGAAYLSDGWAVPEAAFTWTGGRSARLRFATPSPSRDLVFRAHVLPALVGRVTRQRAGVFANGHPVAEWSVLAGGEYTATIPGHFVTDGELELLFSLPDAVVPRQVDRALGDERMLALALVSAVLEEQTRR